ncbi:TPA: hypothetical protein JBB03_10145 [Legionella pneumophila subsp. pneumophila]|nr:hypothetical protein [Legionella pneumophila subsp. pneumophila]HAT9004815.1 hypothetical protein [Legionella pneumophila subsp. pneumophila]
MGWQGRVESRETISRVFLKDPFMGIILIILAKGSSGHKMKFITHLGFYLSLAAALIFAIVLFIDVFPLILK